MACTRFEHVSHTACKSWCSILPPCTVMVTAGFLKWIGFGFGFGTLPGFRPKGLAMGVPTPCLLCMRMA